MWREIGRSPGGARESVPGRAPQTVDETERKAKQFQPMYHNPAVNVTAGL
jgi:hypothetical protein